MDYDGSDLEEYEDAEEEDNESRFEGEEEYSYSVSSEADPEPDVRPRKRSSDVLQEEEEEEEEETADSDSASLRRQKTGGTPPKRARIGDQVDQNDDPNHDNNVTVTLRSIPSPVRQRKRSSEELEEGDVKDAATGNKRAKVNRSSPVAEGPIGLEANRFEGDSLPSTVDEDGCNPPLARGARGPTLHRRISKADMDKLIPLDDLED